MLGSKKSPLKALRHSKVVDSEFSAARSNPFGSDDELDNKKTVKPPRKTPLEPNLSTPNASSNPFDGESQGTWTSSSSSYSLSSAARNKYKSDFRDSGGIENQSVQELENYAVYKAEDTTKTVNGCLKIAEEIRESGTQTLVTLHQQGEQIRRTHNITVEVDHDLSRGEKLLGSLGGMFSKTWKPKKTRHITGPVNTRDDFSERRGNHLEQREKLGLNNAPKGRSTSKTPSSEPTNALQKVEMEKAKQDDALSDLSDLLGQLKDMAQDMGTELEGHTKAMVPLEDDVEELTGRLGSANQRGLRLLGK